MTERQTRIAKKLAMQAARNHVRRLQGIVVTGLFPLEENPALRRCYQMHFHAFLNARPVSRLPYQASEEQVCGWLQERLGLSEGDECFYQIGAVWAGIRILDLPAALRSLWAERDILLITADFRRMLGAGFDSRDEEHFLLDILELPELAPETELYDPLEQEKRSK